MFWARLDSLGPILDLGFDDFEPELGQWTGSTAHAVERMFTVVPQALGRVNYELHGGKVLIRPAACFGLPNWYIAIRTPEDAAALVACYGVRDSSD